MEKYQHLSSPVNSDHESTDSEIVFLKKPTKDRLAPTTSTQEPQDMELDSEVERSKQDRIVRRETVRTLTTSPEVGPASLRCCGSAGEGAGVRPTADSRGPPGGREDGVASQPGAATPTSLYYNLPYSQLTKLQPIQKCLACAVFKAPKFTHTTPILKSLHWLKINQRMARWLTGRASD